MLHQQQQQPLAWNAMVICFPHLFHRANWIVNVLSLWQSDDGWNPRSLSSFQTFPRHPSPPGSSSSSTSSSSSSSSSSSPSSSGPSSPPGLLTNGGVVSHHHSHSKSLIEDDKWPNKNNSTTTNGHPAGLPTHGHSRSLGQATDFTLLPRDAARRQSSLVGGRLNIFFK